MEQNNEVVVDRAKSQWSDLWKKEDYWAIWIGFFFLIVAAWLCFGQRPALEAKFNEYETIIKAEESKPFKTIEWYKATAAQKNVQAQKQSQVADVIAYLKTPARWTDNPLDALMMDQARADERNAALKPKVEAAKQAAAEALATAKAAQDAAAAAGYQDAGLNDAAKAAIDANFCRYTAVPGIPELRAAVGGYFKKFYGEDIAPECTIVSAGGKHALYNFMQASINPGDEVLLPAPYWVSYPYTIQLAGGVPVIVQASLEQGFKVTPEMLDAKCTDKTKLLVLNTPSNPTGAVYNAEELAAILDWADSRDVYVLTDEIYDQLVFAPAKMASAVHHFAKNPEKVAILNGVSKSFAMTGWRVGYVVAHPEIIKKMSSMQGHCTSNICSISQKAALAGLTGPLDFLGEMRNAFQRRRDLAMDIINGWDFASCPCPDGAFYLFVDVRKCFGGTVKNSTELCTWLLDKARVAVVPGAAFGDDNCIRFSYAVSDDTLRDALQRIGDALSQLR